MRRAFLLVLDSLGVGGAPDAAAFGDEGADTLGHLSAACADGRADEPDGRVGPLHVPQFERLGLGAAAHAATGAWPAGFSRREGFEGIHGCAAERSAGKDTPSGHWELAGLPVLFAWTTFPPHYPSFPQAFVDALVEQARLPGILGNRAQSGTAVLDELGAEHMAGGMPILYTSADSVVQIAAHEEVFGLQRLYDVCALARRLADAYRVSRVIARPFTGEPGQFERTPGRRDYTTPPHEATLLDRVGEAGGEVIGIGKIHDIFAGRGVSTAIKGGGDEAVFEATLAAARDAEDRALVFSNFVDLDTRFGHRRNVAGYAACLEALDRRMPELEARLRPGDLCVVTADHGCDPTWTGTDHTRECVPVLAFGPGVLPRDVGRRPTFADVGQTIAAHLGVRPLGHGRAFALRRR